MTMPDAAMPIAGFARVLTIFCEGDAVRGLGHVSRCSAYAEAWVAAGGQVRWMLDGDARAAAMAMATGAVSLGPWQDGLAEWSNGDLALVDSYVADAEVLGVLAEHFRTVVWLDDTRRLTYPAGVVVHPGLDDRATPDWATPGAAEWLTGPKWQPLRAAFGRVPKRTDVRAEVERILVLMGGGDLRGLGPAMAGLARQVYPAARIDLIGSADGVAPDIVVHHDVDAAVMVALMSQADIAISAAGQTLSELACCATPTVLVGIADNQAANVAHWPDRSGFISADFWDGPDRDDRVLAALNGLRPAQVRAATARQSAALIDGGGVARLFRHLAARRERGR